MGASSARLVGVWGLAGNCRNLVNIHLVGLAEVTPLFIYGGTTRSGAQIACALHRLQWMQSLVGFLEYFVAGKEKFKINNKLGLRSELS